MIRKFNKWLFGPSLKVYVACRMTGRDKAEMVNRAYFVLGVLALNEIEGISPVIEESVKADHVKLVNQDEVRLKGFWARDKYIIRRIAHACLFDHAEMLSFGMIREFGLARYCLWKPSVTLLAAGVPVSVAKWEDDSIFFSTHAAAAYMAEKWGSRWKRITWRMKVINRSLIGWVIDQIWQWR